MVTIEYEANGFATFMTFILAILSMLLLITFIFMIDHIYSEVSENFKKSKYCEEKGFKEYSSVYDKCLPFSELDKEIREWEKANDRTSPV